MAMKKSAKKAAKKAAKKTVWRDAEGRFVGESVKKHGTSSTGARRAKR
jgi:hypothetical protein